MPPTLLVSLSPHIYIVPSPDVAVALESGALPPHSESSDLSRPSAQVRKYTNVSNSQTDDCKLGARTFRIPRAVTTRTQIKIQHPQFTLRFPDPVEIEEACQEDEEERTNRAIDRISSRVSEKAAKWVEIMDRAKSEGVTTPWWEELNKCSEGNVAPSRTEGWNHLVASE